VHHRLSTQWRAACASQPQAALPALNVAFTVALPGVARICPHPSPLLQDVLTRLDKTSQAFFRRLPAGQKPGLPRFPGRHRFIGSLTHRMTTHRMTTHRMTRARDGRTACMFFSKIGRVTLHWSRPLEGTPKKETLSHEDDGCDICCWCADAAVPVESLPEPGPETGIDRGIASCATLSDGTVIHNPCCDRKAARRLKTAPRQVAHSNKAQNGDDRGATAASLQASGEVTGESVSDGEAPTAGLPHKVALRLV
jgi:putative transposase